MEAQNALMICYDALVINETNFFSVCICICILGIFVYFHQFQALVLGTSSPAGAQPGICGKPRRTALRLNRSYYRLTLTCLTVFLAVFTNFCPVFLYFCMRTRLKMYFCPTHPPLV